MSSALVRQALELVDPKETSLNKRKKRRAGHLGHYKLFVQDSGSPYKVQKKTSAKEVNARTEDQITEENIKKLLKLSQKTADDNIKEKIVKRAVVGKPLLEKIEIKVEEEKSILFPEESFKKFKKEYSEESFKKFEKEYFCS